MVHKLCLRCFISFESVFLSLIVAGYEVCEEDRDEHGEAVRDLARHLEYDDAGERFS